MILVQANDKNCTFKQLSEARQLQALWVASGYRPRNPSHLQFDTTRDCIALILDHCAHGVSYDPWSTTHIEIDAEGCSRTYNSRDRAWSGWSRPFAERESDLVGRAS